MKKKPRSYSADFKQLRSCVVSASTPLHSCNLGNLQT
jgi:hypothetical protein